MHAFLGSLPVPPPFLGTAIVLIVILSLFALVLKGFSLWYSARASQRNWFIVLLVVNTLGILEIVYLIWFRPKNSKESAVVPLPKDSETVQS
jgi:methionyl-tRNA synthetase